MRKQRVKDLIKKPYEEELFRFNVNKAFLKQANIDLSNGFLKNGDTMRDIKRHSRLLRIIHKNMKVLRGYVKECGKYKMVELQELL